MSQADSGVLNNIMICPKCKKNETSILKTFYESLTNTVKRQRTCKCGNVFVTYEIDKSGLKSKSAIILKNSIINFLFKNILIAKVKFFNQFLKFI